MKQNEYIPSEQGRERFKNIDVLVKKYACMFYQYTFVQKKLFVQTKCSEKRVLMQMKYLLNTSNCNSDTLCAIIVY